MIDFEKENTVIPVWFWKNNFYTLKNGFTFKEIYDKNDENIPVFIIDQNFLNYSQLVFLDKSELLLEKPSDEKILKSQIENLNSRIATINERMDYFLNKINFLKSQKQIIKNEIKEKNSFLKNKS